MRFGSKYSLCYLPRPNLVYSTQDINDWSIRKNLNGKKLQTIKSTNEPDVQVLAHIAFYMNLIYLWYGEGIGTCLQLEKCGYANVEISFVWILQTMIKTPRYYRSCTLRVKKLRVIWCVCFLLAGELIDVRLNQTIYSYLEPME